MEIRPADLGDTYQTALVLRRAHVRNSRANGRAGQRPSSLAASWTRGLNLSESVEQDSLSAAIRATLPARIGLAGIMTATASLVPLHLEPDAVIMGALAAQAVFLAYFLPRSIVRSLYIRHVTEAEARQMQAAALAELPPTTKTASATPFPLGDGWLSRRISGLFGPKAEPLAAATLESDYFDLILAALRLPTPESDVEVALRTTLRQIGDAVAKVRRAEVEAERGDAADLIGDAELLAARARREPDRVVAASLLRQAQAKVAEAKIVETNVALRRRTRALGAELRAQIAATGARLRNMSSQRAMAAESSGAFTAISASVQNLATEAESVFNAREELAVALGGNGGASAYASRPLETETTGANRAEARVTLPAPESPLRILRNRRGGN